MYAYASTDRIPTEDFKDRLVSEIERAMAHADDEQLDDLEYLLMHVEDSHPDRYPGSEMREDDVEAPEVVDIGNKDQWYDAAGEKENPVDLEEAGLACEGCGKMKVEGVCECSMTENEELDEVELGWLRAAADKVKDLAMTDLGGPEGFLSTADKTKSHGKTRKSGESDDFRAWKEKRSAMGESAKMTLSDAIRQIVSEMKLSVAGRAPFHFGGGSEVDEEDVSHFLLSKKGPSSDPPKSGVKAKAKKAKPGRKSKKAG